MDKLEEAKAFAFARLEERRGMKDDWDSQILRMNLCCFCGNEGDVETAYRLFREGIEAFPRDLAAYHCMAEVLLEHGREKEALKLLSSGMKSVPESAMNHLGLYLMIAAKVYDGNLAGNEDLVGKMRDYIADDSREIKDWDTEYGRRGDFYFAVGEDDKALEMAEEKLKLSRSIFYYFSNAHGAWYAKGKVYSRQGNHEKAAECYRKAIEIFGHHKLYEDCLADELAFLEEYK
jgi:tetratricopeptide (TPR) repeat protein